MRWHRLLTALRVGFAVVGMALILSELVWGTLITHIKINGWVLLCLSLMMLAWGLDFVLRRNLLGWLLIGGGVLIGMGIMVEGVFTGLL